MVSLDVVISRWGLAGFSARRDGCLSLTGYNTSDHWWCFWCTITSALTTWVTLCHWSVMILDVGGSVQLPVLTTTSRALEPNSEIGRSRSLVRKRGTTYHNQWLLDNSRMPPATLHA